MDRGSKVTRQPVLEVVGVSVACNIENHPSRCIASMTGSSKHTMKTDELLNLLLSPDDLK